MIDQHEEWANSIVAQGAVSKELGKDGFESSVESNLHFLHEVLFYIATDDTVFTVNEIVKRTKALQKAIVSQISQDVSIKNHLHSMKKCTGICAKHKSVTKSDGTECGSGNWVGMFGDVTDGSTILEESPHPHILRPDLLEKYRKKKIERGELQSTVTPSQLLPPPVVPPPVTPTPTVWSEVDEEVDQELEDAWALVKQRRKQSKFRQRALQNFGGACCLTGVTDEDLLVAAHIVRWADDPNSRLDPTNGLLLYHEYDLLFENGYFYFDDEFKVCLASWIAKCSDYVQARLKLIEGKSIQDKAKCWPIKVEYLQLHRERVSQICSPPTLDSDS